MIFYRFVSKVSTFYKVIDIIMEANEIEKFLEENPHRTFQVTTLMSEDEYKSLDPRWFTNFYMVKSGDGIPGIVPRTIYENSQKHQEDGPR